MNDLGNIFRFGACIAFLLVVAFAKLNYDSCCHPMGNCHVVGQLNPSSIPVVRINLPVIYTGEPQAKRDQSYQYYLQACVRIRVGNSVGSGTICYYDDVKGEAFIISCGHLFEGNKKPNGAGTKTAEIDVFYKNDLKLATPQPFKAQVICYDQDEDISILKFSPDWKIQRYFAIAPVDHLVTAGMSLESTGCDLASEPASYTVQIVEGMEIGQNLITQFNSPRPGRSGGGLLTSTGYYVGVVWGTSALDGSGYGVHVPLRRIHTYLSNYQDIKFLLNVGQPWAFIHRLPIVHPSGSIQVKPDGYLPTP